MAYAMYNFLNKRTEVQFHLTKTRVNTKTDMVQNVRKNKTTYVHRKNNN